jgi:hypothetical protein
MKTKTATAKIIECIIHPSGEIEKKPHGRPMPEDKALKVSLELNEKFSLMDLDLSKPIISYVIERSKAA